jgi:hypothetical protein
MVAMESLRVLNAAIDSGKPVAEYFHQTKFENSLIGPYHFDAAGQGQGIGFEMQQIRGGKAVKLN